MGAAWAAPGSLLGVLLAPFFRRRSIVDGILLCEGASWPCRLGWGYRAVALGQVVLCVDDIDRSTLTHELVHVRQWRAWGPLLAIAYPAASLWALIRGRHPYRDNVFELQARATTAARLDRRCVRDEGVRLDASAPSHDRSVDQ